MADVLEVTRELGDSWLDERSAYQLTRERGGRRVLDPDPLAEFLGSILTRMRLTACLDLDSARRFLVLDAAGTTVHTAYSRERLGAELLAPMLRELQAPDDRPQLAPAVRASVELVETSVRYRDEIVAALWDELLSQQTRRGEPRYRFDVPRASYRRAPTTGAEVRTRWQLEELASDHVGYFLASVPSDVLRSELWRQYGELAEQSGIPARQRWGKSQLFERGRQLLDERRRADGVRVFRRSKSYRHAQPLSSEARAILLRAQEQRRGRL